MFMGATAFNIDLSRWDMRSATTLGNMFNGATAFNQTLRGGQTSRVTSFNQMFRGASSFDGDLSYWVIRSADVRKMFDEAHAFTGRGLDTWQVSGTLNQAQQYANGANERGLFYGLTKFNTDISGWNM